MQHQQALTLWENTMKLRLPTLARLGGILIPLLGWAADPSTPPDGSGPTFAQAWQLTQANNPDIRAADFTVNDVSGPTAVSGPASVILACDRLRSGAMSSTERTDISVPPGVDCRVNTSVGTKKL